MNQKKIWIIIILMTAALLGSILIQSYWIKLAVEENEATFNKNVQTALLKVADRLQLDDERRGNRPIFQFDNSLEKDTRTILGIKSGLDTIENIDHQLFSSELKRKLQMKAEQDHLTRYLETMPIAERVNPKVLDSYIKAAMKNLGVNSLYDYGVWSHQKNSFVIINNLFVFEETEAGMSQGNLKSSTLDEKSLSSSNYQVDLFSSPMTTPPGLLKIYFPNRARIVWSNIVPLLIASILFTGLILACFSYTIYVIFTQKKISEIKTDFINNMTHEFKTPIATISLASDSILNPRVINEETKVKKFANLIKTENKRMLSQVEKVLQISQIDKKDLQLKWTHVNLHDIIHQAVEHLNLKLQAKEGKAEIDLNANNPIIEGDLTHISNIIHNLLDNANKYTPEKPIIKVSTKDLKGGIEVTVKDNGIGMSKESRKHIFEKFYRVPTGNRHDVKGFGLGLSYVKAMMTAHNGQVEVKSELGKGSSFILYFPSNRAA